ncbi:MAG: FadR family transcriptional regulator [Spirochaetes bacterium]|nr:FadR family transcriptional regulator [Spirochaetota bacterium]
MFEHVQNQKYYMQIVDQIRKGILDGRLKTGDRLPPERELAKEFGTSRASIREALSALELLGLIECKIGQGNFIRMDSSEIPIDGELMRELLRNHSPYEIYESRLEIEPSLAALAAVRANQKEKDGLYQHFRKLHSLGDQIQQDFSKIEDFIEDYMEEDRKFHLFIGKCAHNSVLFMVFAGVNLMMKETSWKVLKRKNITRAGNIRKYEREHEAIYTSIRERKPDVARVKMRRHIQDIEKDLFEGNNHN